MTVPVDPPLSGDWPLTSFPDSVTIDGTVFHRAMRRQPYEGVLEQYRAATPLYSAHLMVLDDGRWYIDHIDQYNPDMGHPVKHFFIDHPIGKVLVYTSGGIVGLGFAVMRGLNDKKVETKT